MSKLDSISESVVLEGLASVFQEHGYSGATLTLFTDATGLKRPSLYHRFPGGKLEMALAVIDFAREQFIGEVLAPLLREGDATKRIKEAALNMKNFYDGGNDSCLMDSLSLGAKGEDREAIDKAIAIMFENFIGALTKAAQDLGAGKAEAIHLAEDAVVRLEGSLVVARGTGSTAAFKRTLEQLPNLLMSK